MPNVRSNTNDNIQTIEKASEICDNCIRLVGQLTELTVNIDHAEETNTIQIRYVGVVDVNGSYIRIQGSTHNGLTGFMSTVNTLKTLRANMVLIYSNGEKIKEEFQDVCSIVYIDGRTSSSFSVVVDYISDSAQIKSGIMGYINGVVVDKIDNDIYKILIITNSYHHIITFRCVDKNNIIAHNKTVNFAIRSNSYKDTIDEPIYLEAMNILSNQVHDDIIKNAISEHEMYIKTWQSK